MIMHRCKTLWPLVLSPGLKGPEPPLLSYTTDLPGPCFWIAEHFLDMAWVCSRTLGCFFRRCLLILDRPSTASAKNLTSGRDPRPLHRLSPRECCANLPEGTECSRGSGRLWRKLVYSYIHQRGKSLLTADLYIPLLEESLPLAGSHVLAPFQSYHFSVRGNLYKAWRDMGSSVNPPAQTVSVDHWQHALYLLIAMWWMLCWLLHCMCLCTEYCLLESK